MTEKEKDLRRLLDEAHKTMQVQLDGLRTLRGSLDGARQVNKQLRGELNVVHSENDRLNARIVFLESKMGA